VKRRVLSFLVFVFACSPSHASAQQDATQATVTISFPHTNWAVEIDSPGFTVETNGPKPDGREYLLANNSKTGIVLSATLEKSPSGADSKTCPNYLQKRVQSLANMDLKDVKASEIGGLAVVEYLIPGPKGVPIQQKNFVACTAKDDVYVDIHLSKAQFQDSDESLFIEILKHVRLVDRAMAAAPPAPGTAEHAEGTAPPGSSGTAIMDYFREGGKLFLMQDLSGAIGPYQKALDIEKKQPQLGKTFWYVLVDNLGMAYGITGDLDHAEETFDYGVSEDPNYPLFYYNLACTYAERKNMEKTMDYLKMAFARKANVVPGESMPDPRKDDSFQEFMKDNRFRKLADSLYSSN
jgi:tetratricopeptide (TPR) repeat protein